MGTKAVVKADEPKTVDMTLVCHSADHGVVKVRAVWEWPVEDEAAWIAISTNELTQEMGCTPLNFNLFYN